MVVISDGSRQPLIPNFLYTTHSPSSLLTHRLSILNRNNNTSLLFPSKTCSPAKLHQKNNLMIPAPEPLDMDSPRFYVDCFLEGFFRFGIYHIIMTPAELIKCKMQIQPGKWWNVLNSIETQQGLGGLFTGWTYNIVGYNIYGACKTGFSEFFKKYYADVAGSEYAAKHKTLINVAGSASAEIIATMALCPFEAVKVRAQTQPGFVTGLENGLPKLYRSEGLHGLYKGLLPLWGRQIPCTMMQFALYDRIEEMFYKYLIPTPKNESPSDVQAVIILTAGYVAAVPCAIVSQPADTLFTFLNNAKGATIGDIVKKLGVWGLCTRGLGPRINLLGPLIAVECGLSESY